MSIKSTRRYNAAAGVIGLTAVFGVHAAAGAASTGENQVGVAVLEEILVTAQKREESLQDVPISISVITATDIEQRSVQNVGELISYAPNVNRASGPSSGDDGFFFFRGVGQVDNSGNVDPGVGVYIDDVYLGRIQGASFDVMDVERIEVLRGPQGTLFGRNTIGGAVSVHTRDPGDEFAARVRATAGSRERMDAQLLVNVPVTDAFAFSASAFTRNQDGWATNVRNGDTYGDREDIGGFAKFKLEASDALSFTLAADYSDGEGSPLPTVLLALSPGATTPLGIPFPTDTAADIDTQPFDSNVQGSIEPLLETKRGGVSLTATWDMGGAVLKSISAWRMTDQVANTDLDGTSYSIYDTQFGMDQEQFSQEFQLSGKAADDRLTWLAGVYYFDEDLTNHSNLSVGTNTGGGFLPPAGPMQPPTIFFNPAVRLDGRGLKFDSNLIQQTESSAVFGQLDWQFSDRWSGLFGFRYTKDEKDVTFDNSSDNRDRVFSPVCAIPFPPGQRICAAPGQVMYTFSTRPGSELSISGGPSAFNDSWSEFSPKLGLNFAVNDNALAYVSWSNGFKSGGFPGRATPGNDLSPFDPETLQTYEIGLKSQFADNRVRLNVSAFYSEYQDVQLLIAETVNGQPQFLTRNAGDVDIKGVEIELVARPTQKLDLSASLGWLDNEYKTLSPGAAAFGVTADDTLPNTPEWTGAAGAQYQIGLGGAGALVLRADYNYRSEVSFQAAANPGDIQEGYGLVDVRATWRAPGERLAIAAFGRNVTEEEYYSSLSDQRFGVMPLGLSTGVVGAPSEWGVDVSYQF